MLKTIKGLYKNVIIKPLAKVNLRGNFEVLITFLSPSKKNLERFCSSAGGWEDLDTEKLKKEIYKNRQISTRRKIKL